MFTFYIYIFIYTIDSSLSFSSYDFGDIDNDGDYDFLISGYSFDGYKTYLYENKRKLDDNGAVVQPVEVNYELTKNNFVSVKEGTTQFVDIDQDGKVILMHMETKWIESAALRILDLVREAEVGKIYEGKVVRIEKFGCFVELWPGTDGLVHISRLAKERVEKVESVVSVGDQILVKCIGIDDKGRVDLSRKDALTVK